MAARNLMAALKEAIDRAKRTREENTIKFGEEIREWIGEEWINKCDDPRFLLGASGMCALFFDTAKLEATERSALEQKIMLHFNARSPESFVDRVEINRNIITFHMISQEITVVV